VIGSRVAPAIVESRTVHLRYWLSSISAARASGGNASYQAKGAVRHSVGRAVVVSSRSIAEARRVNSPAAMLTAFSPEAPAAFQQIASDWLQGRRRTQARLKGLNRATF
jgi:hypothetical protein